MNFFSMTFALSLFALLTGCAVKGEMKPFTASGVEEDWRGIHFLYPGQEKMEDFYRLVEEEVVPSGANVIIFEVNYNFEYESNPLIRGNDPMTKEQARRLAALCRKNDIRLIPQFNCVGHQSWAKHTGPLLTHYPGFDETPKIPLNNPHIYCRSWCPLHPAINDMIFPMMDELIEAFEADAFHVGMDEVFLIASDQCPRCKGKDPAEVFAKAVNDYHDYLVKERGLEMLMWGDRLLDAEEMGYTKWEASANGTAPAIDMIPRDIIICDWHYDLQDAYPSIPYLQEKGFRVWPSPWKDKQAALALMDYMEEHDRGLILGTLFTTWTSADAVDAMLGRETGSDIANEMAETFKVVRERW